MNIGKFKKVMLIILFVFTTNSIYADDYFDGLVCEQDISTVSDLTPVYTSAAPYVLYEKEHNHTPCATSNHKQDVPIELEVFRI